MDSPNCMVYKQRRSSHHCRQQRRFPTVIVTQIAWAVDVRRPGSLQGRRQVITRGQSLLAPCLTSDLKQFDRKLREVRRV